MHGLYSVSDYLYWASEMLLILLYGASVAAFTIGLKRGALQSQSYFSGLFFLTLCPFFFLFLAAIIRLAPIFYRVDEIGNAQQMLSHAVSPLYLGSSTTFILVSLYSILYGTRRTSDHRA